MDAVEDRTLTRAIDLSFSAATTRMQSAGQAAAHSEQPTHFSSPVSSKLCSLWRPRKRGYTGTFSSGYCTVTGPSGMRANVVFMPRSVSRNARHAARAAPGAGLRWTSIACSPGLQVIAPPAPQWVATTTIAVTSALTVASGSSAFQPKLISWS